MDFLDSLFKKRKRTRLHRPGRGIDGGRPHSDLRTVRTRHYPNPNASLAYPGESFVQEIPGVRYADIGEIKEKLENIEEYMVRELHNYDPRLLEKVEKALDVIEEYISEVEHSGTEFVKDELIDLKDRLKAIRRELEEVQDKIMVV